VASFGWRPPLKASEIAARSAGVNSSLRSKSHSAAIFSSGAL
jgi:hypothetical protein